MKIASWDFLSKTLGRPNRSEEPAGKKPSVYVFANGHYSLVDMATSFGNQILARFRHGGDVDRHGGIALVSYVVRAAVEERRRYASLYPMSRKTLSNRSMQKEL